jgi:hypothetical protein
MSYEQRPFPGGSTFMMRRILVITDLGHASPRIPGIVKHLPKYGWEATIITPSMSDKQKRLFLLQDERELLLRETTGFAMAYQDPEQSTPWRTFIRRVLKKLGLLQYIAYPDEHRRWVRHAERSAQQALMQSGFDVVLSSSSPVTAHMIARRISTLYGLPWVADLRDLWTQNHNYPFSRIRKFFEARLERISLSKAHALITVTPQWQRTLEAIYGNKVSWLPNGYNPACPRPLPAQEEERFLISYMGHVYAGKQDIAGFLDAFNDWIMQNRIAQGKAVFRYFGRSSQLVERLATRWPTLFKTHVEVHLEIPRSVSQEVQKQSDLLLLLNWCDPEEKGVAPTKLYEYLGTGVQILATGGFGGDYVEQVLITTRAGEYCRSKEEIIRALSKRYAVFEEKGHTTTVKLSEEVKHFSYPRISARLADLLERVAASGT